MTAPKGSTHEAGAVRLDVPDRLTRQVVPDFRQFICSETDDDLIEHNLVQHPQPRFSGKAISNTPGKLAVAFHHG